MSRGRRVWLRLLAFRARRERRDDLAVAVTVEAVAQIEEDGDEREDGRGGTVDQAEAPHRARVETAATRSSGQRLAPRDPQRIHRRIPDYEVDLDRCVRVHNTNVRGFSSVPIAFSPGDAR